MSKPIWRRVADAPPKMHVHHKDKKRTNNAPDNLVVLTPSEHAALHGWERSFEAESCGKSGHVGVYKCGNRWQARLRGTQIGMFATKEEAINAVIAFRTRLQAERDGSE